MSPQFTSSESRFHPGVWIAVPSIDHPGGSTEFRYQHQVEFSRIIPAPSLSSLVLRCPSYPPPPYSRSPPFPPIHLSIYSPCRHSLGVDFPSFSFESLFASTLRLFFHRFFSPFIIITSSTNILFYPDPLSFFSFPFFPISVFIFFN